MLPFWLLLPYMEGLLAAVYAVYLLVRLTTAGNRCGPTSTSRPCKNCQAAACWRLWFAAITAAAQLVQLTLEGKNLPARLVFTLLQAAAAAALYWLASGLKR